MRLLLNIAMWTAESSDYATIVALCVLRLARHHQLFTRHLCNALGSMMKGKPYAGAAYQVTVDIFPLQQVIQRSLGIQLDACFTWLPLTPPIASVAARNIAASELQQESPCFCLWRRMHQ